MFLPFKFQWSFLTFQYFHLTVSPDRSTSVLFYEYAAATVEKIYKTRKIRVVRAKVLKKSVQSHWEVKGSELYYSNSSFPINIGD